MRYIDMQTWPRRKHFEIFGAFDHPHAGVWETLEKYRTASAQQSRWASQKGEPESETESAHRRYCPTGPGRFDILVPGNKRFSASRYHFDGGWYSAHSCQQKGTIGAPAHPRLGA